MAELNDMLQTILSENANRPRTDPEQEHAERRRQWMARRDAERAILAPRLSKPIRDALRKVETPSALLLGRSGIGKSSGARWLLAARRYKLIDCQDLSAAEMAHPLGKGEAPEVWEAKRCKFLIVDDIGTGKSAAALQLVLRHRDNRGLPTIGTTGLTMQELLDWLGAPAVRRLVQQHSSLHTLIFDGYKE